MVLLSVFSALQLSLTTAGGSREESAGSFELSKIMELLWQYRKRREAQQCEDRQEERLRREAEHEQHVGQMQLQLDMMKNLMERS